MTVPIFLTLHFAFLLLKLNAPDIYQVAILCRQLIEPCIRFLLTFAGLVLIDRSKCLAYVWRHLASIPTDIDNGSLFDQLPYFFSVLLDLILHICLFPIEARKSHRQFCHALIDEGL